MPDAESTCVNSSQSYCGDSSEEPTEHSMHTVDTIYLDTTHLDTIHLDTTHLGHDQSSATCEFCIVACQSMVITNDSIASLNLDHSVLINVYIDTLIDTFIATAYRPPILA